MVTHVVLFRMKDRSSASAERALSALQGMAGRIPGLLELHAGLDNTRSDRSFDVALITRHADWDAYVVYRDHPVHEDVKAIMRELADASHSVDFES